MCLLAHLKVTRTGVIVARANRYDKAEQAIKIAGDAPIFQQYRAQHVALANENLIYRL